MALAVTWFGVAPAQAWSLSLGSGSHGEAKGGGPPSGSPSNATASCQITGQVSITWTGVTGAADYNLYYSINGGAYSILQRDITGTSATITPGNLSSQTWTFEVVAADGNYWEGGSATTNSVIVSLGSCVL